MGPRRLTATYRLQLRREFPLAAARELVPYFHRLGVSHLYLSPLLAARAGSAHGYDVVDPARLNPELGTEEDLAALAADLHAREMGIVLDIVPNHMAATEDNRYWDDVLRRGRGSRHADWFDIEWDAPQARGRVVLPVLGDGLDAVLRRGELTLRIRDSGARVAYRERSFPLDPATLPRAVQLAQLDPSARAAADEWAAGAHGMARIRSLLDAQHYRLVHWKDARDLNYRRFFDVNDLVATRMESEDVFQETHALVLRWVRDGVLDGLRVDHVDGLRSPAGYLARLRAEADAARRPGAPERFLIFVEKILSGDESLPDDWPVDGSTGYDFLNDVEDLFLEPEGFAALEAAYRALRHNPSLAFRAAALEGKRRALAGPLWPDVMRAARAARAWKRGPALTAIAAAIAELVVHLRVYRTYVDEPGIVRDADRAVLAEALAGVRKNGAVDAAALALLEDAFFAPPAPGDQARAELVSRVQQASGPAAAKGVEDTALYVYLPLASRNEVGGEPDRPLRHARARFHARNAARAAGWPSALLAVDTHDTKRSADLRARLDVLTTMPREWMRHVTRWRRLNRGRKRDVRGRPTPDTNSEYLYYQTLLGLWPAPRPERRADDLPERDWLERAAERLSAYMLKAAREAKTRTSWVDADPQFELALQTFVRETLSPAGGAHFLGDIARLTARAADPAFRLSLARVLLQCTAPGVPDVYQGDELWTFTLVDPDNRRPVDYEARARLLGEAEEPEAMSSAARGERLLESRAKLALLTCLLRFRRRHAELFARGDYLPLLATDTDDLIAFSRRWGRERCIAASRTRWSPNPSATSVSPATSLPDDLVGSWRSVLTGRDVELVRAGGKVTPAVDDLIPSQQACELLYASG